MTIIVFLIDTSASMNQKTFIGARPTLLDIAKGAVENFCRLRQKNPESRFDRYMLFTTEDPPNNIKAGWKENLATFMNELRNIKAFGLSTIGPAIKNVFDVLNINRMQSGIDTYGSGRSPFYLEPSLIVCITDGGKLSSSQGIQDDIFPLSKSNPIPGAELTHEVFRWDQRLFGLVLRMTGTPTPDTMGMVPSDNSPLDRLCEKTGGRSYAVRTYRMFMQCLDSLVQKVQSGVVINFEKIGPDPPPVNNVKENNEIMEIEKENSSEQSDNNENNVNGNIHSTSWHQCRKMIYVPRPPHGRSHGCFWPIPESFWPDNTLASLPARSAHPNLKFTCTSQEPMVIDNLPFDKYELEPSPLTQYILSRKQPTICWQVFIANSSKNSDVGHPFGYLKASTTKQCVNLFVMPYNYPVLLPLLDDLFKAHRLKPTKEWKQHFENYVRAMPPYYITPLKRALERMGLPNLVPEKYDSSLSYTVVNTLKKLKGEAKKLYEDICAQVEKRVSQNSMLGNSQVQQDSYKVQPKKPLPRHFTSNHLLQDKFATIIKAQVTEHANFHIRIYKTDVQAQLYKNPFDISIRYKRQQLVDQLARMRANFLQKSSLQLLTDKGPDQLHCKPISQMGNYQDYLKKFNPPLREIESTPVRQHMFGNPFKVDKQKMSVMVDEADDEFGGANQNIQRQKRPMEMQQMYPLSKGPKRRKGPLPPDFSLERYLATPPSSPIPTPSSSPPPPLPPLPVLIPPVPSVPPSPVLQPVPSINYAPPPPVISPILPYIESPSLNGPLLPTFSTNTSADESITPNVPEVKTEPKPEQIPEVQIKEEAEQNHTTPRIPPVVVEQRNGQPSSNSASVNNFIHTESAHIITSNKRLLHQLYKDVKKPGRDFRQLFDRLKRILGSNETRIRTVKKVMDEAQRFKRQYLVNLLSHHLEELQNSPETSPLSHYPINNSYINNVLVNGHN